jgi:hypothetical protein
MPRDDNSSHSKTRHLFTECDAAHCHKYDTKALQCLGRLCSTILALDDDGDGDEKTTDRQQNKVRRKKAEQLLGLARKLHKDVNLVRQNDYARPSMVQRTTKRIQNFATEWESLIGTEDKINDSDKGDDDKIEEPKGMALFWEQANDQVYEEQQEEHLEEIRQADKRRKRKKKEKKRLEQEQIRQKNQNQKRREQEAAQEKQMVQNDARYKEIRRKAIGPYASLCRAHITEHAEIRWQHRGLENLSLTSFLHELAESQVIPVQERWTHKGNPKFVVKVVSEPMSSSSFAAAVPIIFAFVLNVRETTIITVLRDDDDYDYKKMDQRLVPQGKRPAWSGRF